MAQNLDMDFGNKLFTRMNLISKKAYTLVELLVVAAILTFGFAVLISSTSGDGAKLSSAQRTLSGLVKAARSQAILKNAQVRLIVHNDDSDLDKYRRFVGVVYFGADSGNTDGWIAATQGTYLPKGIYFDAVTSDNESAWNGSITNMNYPRRSAQPGNAGTEYLYYEFNDNGTSLTQNAYLVFRAAAMIPNADNSEVSELRVSPGQSGLVSGLILRSSGTATLIDEPGAINVSNDNQIN